MTSKIYIFISLFFSFSLLADIKKQNALNDIQELLNPYNDISSSDLSELTKLAEAGNVDDQLRLVGYYIRKMKIKEAIRWAQKAASQEHADSQFLLGCLYLMAKDLSNAVKWTKKSADQGFTKAEGSLGVYYFLGIGIKKDINKAIEWLTKAAKKGDPGIQRMLGVVYTAEKKHKKSTCVVYESGRKKRCRSTVLYCTPISFG